ncbi:hypothetical protein EW093_16690 [Thiospirochaeta perfilievii]|uniref:Transposase n=1 Tax=Thiospirochaeta perfilievii TaxID=252967 RepID=A0A5C1QIE7_9SPIO|nr:hypothetical protein [Thiospirochaeta perfilievii]QEN03563.1 hypothetical protein EW093_02225 [Thiospirochaeta perfilievii]QEN04141.1 hypothetical protein EW093_05300 [Thiospirochaeta perfilievii]QEN04153.1 hypothetical protein EW093_05360 [Thiospirochaeta perfilievii]QEN04562.1 hypothetical protein EW093_07550 [Thiospirochaeta perfilievii]QEN04758.1 hypothetical protein EW093_08585 [Thiospirochaeta perfilievii]
MKSRKSHEEWKLLVSEFNKSGQSVAAFSRENNLKASTFIYWVKMFSINTEKSNLVKIKPKTSNSKKTHDIKIIVNDTKIEICGVINSDKISKIIAVLMEVN